MAVEKSLFKVLQVIRDKKLIFPQDVADHLGITRATLYNWFPAGSEEHGQMSQAIQENRISLKVSMRNKWYKSQAPALQISLYKMLANEDEKKALSMKYVDVTTKGEAVQPLDISKVPTEVLEALLKSQKGD